MSATQTALLIIGVLVLVVLAAAAWFLTRRRSLRQRFGPEYDRVVADQDSRREAERELRDRERRHTTLDIRPLDPQTRERYASAWRDVQAQFVEDPARAVVAGDELLTRLVADRGYPTENYEDQVSYLSVEHARTLGHYRDAHDIYLRGQRGEASTEQLRQALVHYRVLFADLLDESPAEVGSPDVTTPEVTTPDVTTSDVTTPDVGTPDERSVEERAAEDRAAEDRAAEDRAAEDRAQAGADDGRQR